MELLWLVILLRMCFDEISSGIYKGLISSKSGMSDNSAGLYKMYWFRVCDFNIPDYDDDKDKDDDLVVEMRNM
jgi:hypothetical protein